MKSVIICLLALSAVFAYESLQVETGREQTISFNAGHILQTQNGVPRSVDVKIKFGKAFKSVPKVAVVNTLLDWQAGSPQGFTIATHSITKEGFTVRYTAVSPREMYSIYIQWMAFNDPRLNVQWFETTDMGPVAVGEGGREHQHNIAIEGITYDKPPVIVPFLVGAKITRRNYLIFIRVRQVTEKSFQFHFNTWYISNIAMIRACFVMGPSDALWTIGERGFRVPDANHPFLNRGPSGSSVKHEFDIPKQFIGSSVVPLVGLTGWDVEEARNMRVQCIENDLKSPKGWVQLTTWWDSQVVQINFSAMLYLRDPNYKIFDPNCAELFSECNFEGDSITVCDRIKDLPNDAGWSKPVKSVKVPDQRVLKLFNRVAWEGNKAIFVKTESCIKNMQFTFAQLAGATLVKIEDQ